MKNLFIELECHHCPRTYTVDLHGKDALEDKEKYDTKIHGKPYTMVCFCGHDLHKIGALKEDSILKKRSHYQLKDDINRVAEL